MINQMNGYMRRLYKRVNKMKDYNNLDLQFLTDIEDDLYLEVRNDLELLTFKLIKESLDLTRYVYVSKTCYIDNVLYSLSLDVKSIKLDLKNNNMVIMAQVEKIK